MPPASCSGVGHARWRTTEIALAPFHDLQPVGQRVAHFTNGEHVTCSRGRSASVQERETDGWFMSIMDGLDFLKSLVELFW